jgi:membrane fusion protein, heavy metal efflux system
MKQLILFLLLIPTILMAHGGDDHGAAAAKTNTASGVQTSETYSEKYELLIKYGYFKPGTESVLKLFISNYITNEPLDSVQLSVKVAGNSALALVTTQIDRGVFEVIGVFPENIKYNLVVSINGSLGPDLLQLNDIEPGKVVVDEVAATHAHWYSSNWFIGLMGLLVGLLIMFFVMKKRNHKIGAALILLYCLLPVSGTYNANAHEGHNEPAAGGGSVSNMFSVEKETQFLFNILTEMIGTGDFNESFVMLGTVVAAPEGKAVIQSPQTGKIASLKVSPGQRVSRGQVVAVIEQQIDAGTQISITAQSNSVMSEYDAAKAQYERLKAIEDIAAKKDITEAKARFESAKRNKELFENNTGKNNAASKYLSLTSPVSGVVGNFNYAIGAVVNGGETIFEVTNLEKVFVEAQLFANDIAKLKASGSFTTVSKSDTSVYKLKLISTAQSVNSDNQSQNVLFEIINPKGSFKIGENINVRTTGANSFRQVVVPNEAVTEVNGRPVVFIKDNAEHYSISFVLKSESNDRNTIILKGVEDGERVVVKNVYQMKMMYLNQ